MQEVQALGSSAHTQRLEESEDLDSSKSYKYRSAGIADCHLQQPEQSQNALGTHETSDNSKLSPKTRGGKHENPFALGAMATVQGCCPKYNRSITQAMTSKTISSMH